MKIKIDDKKQCCGCTACASVCAQKAITMEADELGFLYPKVDETKCNDCGLCGNICQFHDGYNRYDNYESPLVYGCRHKDESELAKSQSGAASFAIIDKFLDEEGAVYGAAFSEGFHVVHKRATTKEDCLQFRGSKYVQSDLRGVFFQIKDDLRNGMRVLFIGTSCQVAGLRSFVPCHLSDKLFTVDIVCHATPSPSVWEEYVKYLEKKYKEKIVAANFRDKRFGWKSHVETFTFESGKEIERTTFRLFYFFNNHISIRKSCSECHFTNMKRIGDISLADFWGWTKHHTEWNDNKGVSLVLVNSDKGKALFDSTSDVLLSIQCNIEECIQPQLLEPVDINPNQDQFIKEFVERGFDYCGRKYGDLSLKYKLKKLYNQKVKESILYRKLKSIKKSIS